MKRKLAAIARMPTGTLTKKIQLQCDVLGEQAADERADRERERRHARPDPDRRAALVRAGTSPR